MKISRGTFVAAAAILILNGCGGGGCDDCNPAAYTIGASVNGLVGSRLALRNNGVTVAMAPGTTGQVPALFSGLANGASYEVTVATQPTNPSQTCVVTNGRGTIAGSNVEISLACTTTPPRFLLAQNKLGAPQLCITTAAIDSDSGVLTAVAAPPLCGGFPVPLGSMAAEPQGKFLYMAVPNGQIGFLAGFTIDQASGAVSLSQTDDVIEVRSVATDPSGKFLFLADDGPGGLSGGVGTFMINSASGTLTSSGGLALNDGHPFGVSVDPLDRFVYVSYFQGFSNPDFVIPLTLDSTSGALSRVAAPVAVDVDDWVLADPSGRFLYVGNGASNTISAFKVDPATGTLTAVAGAPFTITNGAGQGDSFTAAIDPSGNYLYVASYEGSNISAYTIDHSSGQLAPINGSPYPTGAAPNAVVTEPLGRFVYVSDNSGVSAFRIDAANGTLTAVSGSPFPFAFGGRITFSY
jgi:6-phosphogluconolactonase (cycloisomerase 2 family)